MKDIFNIVYRDDKDKLKEYIDGCGDMNVLNGGLMCDLFHATLENQSINCARLLIENGYDINKKFGKSGETHLHYSCMWDMLDEVKFLLNLGANVNIQDNRGNTPLHNANIDEEHGKEIIKMLIWSGGDIYIKNNSDIVAYEVNLDANFRKWMIKFYDDFNELDTKNVEE